MGGRELDGPDTEQGRAGRGGERRVGQRGFLPGLGIGFENRESRKGRRLGFSSDPHDQRERSPVGTTTGVLGRRVKCPCGTKQPTGYTREDKEGNLTPCAERDAEGQWSPGGALHRGRG